MVCFGHMKLNFMKMAKYFCIEFNIKNIRIIKDILSGWLAMQKILNQRLMRKVK